MLEHFAWCIGRTWPDGQAWRKSGCLTRPLPMMLATDGDNAFTGAGEIFNGTVFWEGQHGSPAGIDPIVFWLVAGFTPTPFNICELTWGKHDADTWFMQIRMHFTGQNRQRRWRLESIPPVANWGSPVPKFQLPVTLSTNWIYGGPDPIDVYVATYDMLPADFCRNPQWSGQSPELP